MSRDWHCVPPRAANWDTPTRSHRSKGDLLIDGRNRVPTCLDLGIEPKVREFGEADSGGIGRYIIAANIYRRHLDPDQQIIRQQGHQMDGRRTEPTSGK